MISSIGLVTLGVAAAVGLASSIRPSTTGVAIAVARVPPLGVVGLKLRAGLLAEARGAFLLFGTKFVSIILSAVLVFLLTGFTDLEQLERHGDRVVAALSTVLIAGLVILVPLAFTVEVLLTAAFGWPTSIRVEFTPTQVQVDSQQAGSVEDRNPQREPERGPMSLAVALLR